MLELSLKHSVTAEFSFDANSSSSSLLQNNLESWQDGPKTYYVKESNKLEPTLLKNDIRLQLFTFRISLKYHGIGGCCLFIQFWARFLFVGHLWKFPLIQCRLKGYEKRPSFKITNSKFSDDDATKWKCCKLINNIPKRLESDQLPELQDIF